MATGPADYVERTEDDAWRVRGTRVSLDSVVHAYWDGRSAEEIAIEFPALALEQIHGAIAFYLRNRKEVDAHLERQKLRWADGRRESGQQNQALLERLHEARDVAAAPRAL
jgi:uncharacterized protein (DUF433 family)